MRKKKTSPKRGESRAPKISQTDLAAARKFLTTDPIGRRLQAADHALTLLVKGDLPRLRDFVFRANFDLRVIDDGERFQEAVYADRELSELVKESRGGGCVKVTLEKNQIQITLFYGKNMSDKEAVLYSRSLGEVGALTYASLGLDMRGLAAVDGTLKE